VLVRHVIHDVAHRSSVEAEAEVDRAARAVHVGVAVKRREFLAADEQHRRQAFLKRREVCVVRRRVVVGDGEKVQVSRTRRFHDFPWLAAARDGRVRIDAAEPVAVNRVRVQIADIPAGLRPEHRTESFARRARCRQTNRRRPLR
jgi:hypothetical protein